MTTLVQFTPIYQERVWGGRGLETFLRRSLPAERPIGESWEIVDRPEAQSVIREGAWQGLTLRDLLARHAAEVMGPAWPGARAFPILVKWLDCRERLSLQVHPPASIAAKLGGEPKTENWYVAHAEPGAGVMAGLKAGVDAPKFRAAIEDKTAEQLVHRHATRAGDSILIRSGVMHAIDGGNIILEIQQNSDTTYRVYDWGRMGLDGRPRAMHVEQSMACLEANTAGTPQLVQTSATDGVLADCREFRIRYRRLQDGEKVVLKAGEQSRILSVARGRLEGAGVSLAHGANALVPYATACELVARGETTVLITENYSSLEK